MNCQEVNPFCIVDYLSPLGHQPKKEKGASLLVALAVAGRKGPFFQGNKVRDVWYDHGIENGGILINLLSTTTCCSVSEFLSKVSSLSLCVSATLSCT